MNETEFWNLIEQARRSVTKVAEVPSWLVNHLKEMPTEQIIEFGNLFRSISWRAYDWRLWAAAANFDCCSDDDFYKFRAWLIAQGKSVFDRALVDPDSLADLDSFDGDDGVACLDSMAAVPSVAYRAKTGRRNFGELLAKVPSPVLKHKDEWDGKPESLKHIVPRLHGRMNSTRQPKHL